MPQAQGGELIKKNNMNNEKQYLGTYKVLKIFRKSRRREVIRRGLTIDEARALVNSYPDSNRSMVIFTKQFWADKYFVELQKLQ